MNGRSSIWNTAALVILAGFAVSVSHAQDSLDTAFTYQGQLKLLGEPLNATADFEFKLWDEAETGNQIGAVYPVNNVTVADGLFTVEIDFGRAALDGAARWLEIAVRSPAGGGAFTTLSPRQKITPAPFAIKTLGVNPRQISALEAQSSMAGLVTVSPTIQYRLIASEIWTEDVTLVGIALHENVCVIVDIRDENGDQEYQLHIEKRPAAAPSTVKAFTVNIKVVHDSGEYEASVSPADPIYSTAYDLNYPDELSDFTATLTNDSYLRLLTYDPAMVRFLVLESATHITGYQVGSYSDSGHDVDLTVSIRNIGDYYTTGVVTLTNCPATVDPVPALGWTLNEDETTDLVFHLHNSVPFVDTDECTLSVKGPHGKTYNSVVVDFPPPSNP